MEASVFFNGGYYEGGVDQFSPKKRHFEQMTAENFVVEDLLDFSNEGTMMTDDFLDSSTGNSNESSTFTTVDSCNSTGSGEKAHFSANLSCRSFSNTQLSGELCVPYDDLAELEWLSNIYEESFSSEDLHKLQLISGMQARSDESSETTQIEITGSNPILRPQISVPGKARSKRSRAAPCDWSSRLLLLSPATSLSGTVQNAGKKAFKTMPSKTEEGRKCLHCAVETTPQWRTGPLGPKTLCNACGVRYKSGRLVPEYRPAASPTFVPSKHSNSHRKVIELRRQQEMQRAQNHQQIFNQSALYGDSYLIHQVGPHIGQLL